MVWVEQVLELTTLVLTAVLALGVSVTGLVVLGLAGKATLVALDHR
jgi:hypothetical protein